MSKVGRWAFIAGLVIAILLAFMGLGAQILVILAVLGLIVGFLNVSGSESHEFLIASIALIASAGAVQSLPLVGGTVTTVMGNLVIFISPAMLVVAIKSLLGTVKN